MSRTDMTSAARRRIARAQKRPSGREVGAAVIACAGLYVVGGALTATALLLPHVSAPAAIAAVGVDAQLTAAGLYLAFRRRWGGLALAFTADLWGVVLIAILCVSSGGAASPFALIYLFAIGHAAAFQPRGRFVIVATAALVAFLAPFAYEDVPEAFVAVAIVGIALALITMVVIHLALNGVREHRRRLQFLLSATATFDSSLDPAGALRTFARAAVPELAELCVIDLTERDGSIGTTVAAAIDPEVAEGVERLRKELPLDVRGTHPVAQVLQTGEPVIADLTDRGTLRAAAQGNEHERFMHESGYRSAAVFPLTARGRTHGAISFLHVDNDERYEGGVLAILGDLAGRAAMAFDNARLYAEQADTTTTLRRSLMPSVLPRIPGLELASYFRPMGAGSEVGGDFYDVFGDSDNCWLMVGDVCGKGAEAAAVTGFVRHTTVAYARESTSPGVVLSKVNRAMVEQDFDGRFATAVLVHLRFQEGAIAATIASGGHPPALLTRRSGRASDLGDRGTLLGIFADPVIEEASTMLEPGDSLALYTDGLLEAHAPARTLTSEEMIRGLEQRSPRAAQDAIDALLGLIEIDDDVRDDIAILTARVTGVTSGPGSSGEPNNAAAGLTRTLSHRPD
jgi:serine phosphatase RsbU (regulator of sigma subunit)